MRTPEVMYDESGEKIWECNLNSYGKVRNFKGEWKGDCPFRYQGQYEDIETGLYYNRFRYYSPSEGMYISQDPIKLTGGNKFYSYVHDTNGWIDLLGLSFWKGFSKGQLRAHYQKHVIDQGEFGNITQAEYLAKAKDFGGATGGAIQEVDVDNFKIKHDPTTGEVFVGHTKKKEIRTYYIDDGRSPDAFADAKKLAGDLSSGCK